MKTSLHIWLVLIALSASVLLAPPAEPLPKDTAAEQYKKYEENNGELERKQAEAKKIQDELTRKRAELDAAIQRGDSSTTTRLKTEVDKIQLDLSDVSQLVKTLESNNQSLKQAYLDSVKNSAQIDAQNAYIPSIDSSLKIQELLKENDTTYKTLTVEQLKERQGTLESARIALDSIFKMGIIVERGQERLATRQEQISAVQDLQKILSRKTVVDRALNDRNQNATGAAQPASQETSKVVDFFKTVALQFKALFSKSARLQLAVVRAQEISNNLSKFSSKFKSASPADIQQRYDDLAKKQPSSLSPSETIELDMLTSYFQSQVEWVKSLQPYLKESLSRAILQKAEQLATDSGDLSLSISQIYFERALNDFAGLGNLQLQDLIYAQLFEGKPDLFTKLGESSRDWREKGRKVYETKYANEADPARKADYGELLKNFDLYRARREVAELVTQQLLQSTTRTFLAKFLSDVSAKTKYVDDLKKTAVSSTVSGAFSPLPRLSAELLQSEPIAITDSSGKVVKKTIGEFRSTFEQAAEKERSFVDVETAKKSYRETSRIMSEQAMKDAPDSKGDVAKLRARTAPWENLREAASQILLSEVVDAFFDVNAPKEIFDLIRSAQYAGKVDAAKIKALVLNNQESLMNMMHKRLFGKESFYVTLGIGRDQRQDMTPKALRDQFAQLDAVTQAQLRPEFEAFINEKIKNDQELFLVTEYVFDNFANEARVGALIEAINIRIAQKK